MDFHAFVQIYRTGKIVYNIDMKRVGDRLREFATRSHDESEIDLFARSAYNRYYYASYLEARQITNQIIPTCKLTHKDLPEMFSKHIKNKIKGEIDKCLKKHIIDESDSKKLSSKVMTNLSELAMLFDYAYTIRVVADYKAEIKIQADNEFKLHGCNITAASKWPGRAKLHCTEVLNVWRKLGHI